jgi:predicted AlkP superfamily phosphohydrolase/phosphomutase
VTARLVVLCVDGGDDDLLVQLAGSGRMPALGQLVGRGTTVTMETPADPLDLGVWPMLVTGQPPGNHALAHFLEFEPRTMGVRVRRETELEPFWLHLPERGRGVVALDVPEVHPTADWEAEATCCWHGYAPPHPALITSKRLRRALRPLGQPPEFRNPRGPASPVEEDQLVATLHRGLAFQAQAALVAGGGSHTVCVGFQHHHAVVHWLGHHYLADHWHHPGPARPELALSTYEALDAALGRIIDAHEDANIAVVVARGGRPANQSPGLLDGLLERAGLQVRRAGDGNTSAPERKPPIPLRLLQRIPEEWRSDLASHLPPILLNPLLSRQFRAQFAWDRTSVFNLPSWDAGLIRVNVVGREAFGIVPPAEYEATIEEVTKLVRETVDADTGRPLATDVVRLRHAFPGTNDEVWPDLAVVWAGERPAHRARHPRLGAWEAESVGSHWSEHRSAALTILAGPSVPSRPERIDADPLGLAPTLLALSGTRRPSVMPSSAWSDLVVVGG